MDKELKKLINDLRKLGVSRYKQGELEIEFFNPKVIEKKPRIKKIIPPGESLLEEAPTEETPSEDALLFWSVTDI